MREPVRHIEKQQEVEEQREQRFVVLPRLSSVDRVSGKGTWLLMTRKYRDWETDRKSTRLNSSHSGESRMPSSA